MNESDDEQMVTSETGGTKGQKLARFDLIPPGPLRALAEHFGRGARKYAPRNWEKGYNWSLSYAALQRHLNAFWSGEDWDAETGSHHLDAAMFHVMALREFVEKQQKYDDRPGPTEHQLAEDLARTFAEGLERTSETPFQEADPSRQLFNEDAIRKQVPEGRDRTVQTGRWELP